MPKVARETALTRLRKLHKIVVAPEMSAEALKQLAESAFLAGHHKAKDRGTFQSTLIAALAKEDNELGEFLRCHRGWADRCVKLPCFICLARPAFCPPAHLPLPEPPRPPAQ